MSSYEPIKKSALAEEIAARLISLIKEKSLQPGDKLPPERELAEMLNVSRPSLREALRALAILNIVEIRQGDGTYVSSLDPQMLVEHLDLVFSLEDSTLFQLFEVRKIFEPALAALAAERITDTQVEELEQIMEAAHDAEDDPEQFTASDLQLHEKIAEVSGNFLIIRIMSSLSQLSQASRHRTGVIPGVLKQTSEDHHQIVAALRARKPAGARRAMLTHLENVEKSLKSILEAESNSPDKNRSSQSESGGERKGS
ncbi:MAG: FadR/GntR family transcriptional regulator [Anaerolineales bacterium]|nr:FadR/GntR family transcriptional regulator [Anaerolineales bacterium]